MSRDPKSTERAICLIGGPQTGKTESLVERTHQLLARGEDSVLVLCAGDWLASSFRTRLEQGLGGKLTESGLCITTPRRLAAKIVGEPAAKEVTGRGGHVMDPYEQQLFFEDMRTITMKGRRLKGILDFIYRELSELHDETDWDATYEEELVLRHARNILSFNGGILECELAGFAIQSLESNEALRKKYSRRHVIVDDYSALSRGMQVLATRLATESIAIAGDETDCGPTCDEHPYIEGISEFLEANPGAKVARLENETRPEGISKAMVPIRAGLHDDEQSRKDAQLEQEDRTEIRPESFGAAGVSVQIGETMGDELKTIAQAVYSARQKNQTVLICGTDRVWRANVRRALESVGFASSAPRPPIRVRDFGNEKAIGRALEDARAKLVANPHDSVAWRSIVGLGDYVGKSDALQELRELTQDKGLGIECALEALANGEIEGARAKERSMADLLKRYLDAKSALANGTWDGQAQKTPEDTPAPWQASPVMIAGPMDCFGTQADIVIFGGFVNGLIPSRDYFDGSKLIGNRLAFERRCSLQKIYLAAGRARQKLVFTAFERASLEVAERLSLHIVRIKLKQGVRTATVSPSIFLHTMELA